MFQLSFETLADIVFAIVIAIATVIAICIEVKLAGFQLTGDIEIMRDHPFGVGWGNTADVYQKKYSPPEDGAGAITSNDYLMIGTQLGIPALLCFLAYVALCFKKLKIENSEFRIKTACRAAVLSLLVAFWFDNGLFDLPTAVVFWVLLELGAYDSRIKNLPSPVRAEVTRL